MREGLSMETFKTYCARLEAAKNQDFRQETLATWYTEFTARGWDDRKFVQRYNAILQMPQVRRDITIDDWFHAPPASDMEVLEDAKKLAGRTIEMRKAEYVRSRKSMVENEELAREGLISLRELYADTFEAEKAKFIARMQKRCERGRTWLANVPVLTIQQLYNDLLDKEMIRPIGELVERDSGMLRKYVRDLLPMTSAKDEWLRDVLRNYLRSEIVDILDEIEARYDTE